MAGIKTCAIALALGALGLIESEGAGSRSGESIRFTVEEGATSTKTFVWRGYFQTALIDIGVSGMEVEIPEIDLSAKWRREVVVEDEYRSMRAGAPRELVRSFETIEHELECTIDIDGSEISHQEESEPDCQSELEGTQVLFAWNEDAGVYEKRYVDEEDGDVDLLDGLTEDMDLRALLPEDEVDAGDEWAVEPGALVGVLMAGGDLGVVLGKGDAERGPEMSAAGLDPRVAGALEVFLGEASDDGEVTATLVELREVDGRRVALISIVAELETNADCAERSETWMREYDPDEEGVIADLEEALVACELELKGELLWDLEGGHARSLELTGEVMVTLVRSVSVDADGQEVGVEMELEMEGELSLTATFE